LFCGGVELFWEMSVRVIKRFVLVTSRYGVQSNTYSKQSGRMSVRVTPMNIGVYREPIDCKQDE
jgi:hypothetical protein